MMDKTLSYLGADYGLDQVIHFVSYLVVHSVHIDKEDLSWGVKLISSHG